MTKEQLVTKFEDAKKVLEEHNIVFDARYCLNCIEYGKQQMLAGECTVEAYYKAKEVLLTNLECANEFIH